MYGEVLVTLNVRKTPDTSQGAIGQLQPRDLVHASAEINGWWKLSKITRGDVSVPLFAPDCYAFTGMNNGYIKPLPAPNPEPQPAPTPTKTPLTVTIEGPGYKTVTVTVDPE